MGELISLIQPDKSVLDEMWAEVKTYYESSCKIQFHGRPRDENVKKLYRAMHRLASEMTEHFKKIPEAKVKFFAKQGFVEAPLEKGEVHEHTDIRA